MNLMWMLFLLSVSPQGLPLSSDFVVAQHAKVTDLNGIPPIEVDVVNRTTSALTAWKITFVITYSDGRTARRSLARDVYTAASGLDPQGMRVGAGATAREALPISVSSGRAVERVHAEIVFAIFADGSWIGDPAGVREVFAQRREDEQAWTFVGELLRSVQSQESREALQAALQRLNRPDQTAYTNRAKITLRRLLQDLLKSELTDKTGTDAFFQQWIARAESRAQAARTHAQQHLERGVR